MTSSIELLLELLHDDRELLDMLVEHEIIPPGDAECSDEQLADAMVARTLVRELEVNANGVEIILRMRGELLAIRRQVAELVRLLGERSTSSR